MFLTVQDVIVLAIPVFVFLCLVIGMFFWDKAQPALFIIPMIAVLACTFIGIIHQLGKSKSTKIAQDESKYEEVYYDKNRFNTINSEYKVIHPELNLVIEYSLDYNFKGLIDLLDFYDKYNISDVDNIVKVCVNKAIQKVFEHYNKTEEYLISSQERGRVIRVYSETNLDRYFRQEGIHNPIKILSFKYSIKSKV